jgi:hypothetical protein
VARLSAQDTGRLYPPPPSPGDIPGTHFCLRLSRPQGHSVVGRIKSMENPKDAVGNRTHDLPACSPVPQPTASDPIGNRTHELTACSAVPHPTALPCTRMEKGANTLLPNEPPISERAFRCPEVDRRGPPVRQIRAT